MPFKPVCPEAELGEGQLIAIEIDGRAIIVCHGESGFYAMDDLCTHNGASLAGGRVKKNSVACPMHGARFDLATGACLARALGCPPIVTHQVRVEGGQIEVALSDQPVEPPMV
jgi:nitrite reductase/ring-hydroxylating ferredoxin subunit